MKTNNISFPHPVLRIKQGDDDLYDDIIPALDANCVALSSAENLEGGIYRYKLTLTQNDFDITKLVKANKAEYVCEVSCPKTFYRKCFKSNTNVIVIDINRTDVQGVIMFNSYIALTDKFNYRNSHANELYNNTVFSLYKGDILALFPEQTKLLGITENDLKAGKAYIVIAKDLDGKYPSTDLNSEKITVNLPSEMYSNYTLIPKTELYDSAVIASLLYGALIEALRHYNNGAFEDKLWHKCLEWRLNQDDLKDIDVEDSDKHAEIVNIILQNPVERMLTLMNKKD